MKGTLYIFMLLLCSGSLSFGQGWGIMLAEKPTPELDTVYFHANDGLQMIMVDHGKLYDALYMEDIVRSFSMSQAQYFPPRKMNEYFFRDREGNVRAAFNSEFSLDELSSHFQSLPEREHIMHHHTDYFVDTNLYYASRNMAVYNGYYLIRKKNEVRDIVPWDYGREGDGKAFWGLMDTTGKVILATLYDEILVLPKGFLVKKDGKWGMTDRDGRQTLPFEYDRHTSDFYRFDNHPLDNELTYFYQDYRYKLAYFMKLDSLVYLKDYHRALHPKKGLFVLKEEGKYGVVDLINDEVLIPPVYERPDFSFHDPNRSFYHLEYAYLIAKKKGKYGLFNLKHKVLLPFKYDKIYNKHESRKGYFKVELNGEVIEIEN